MSKAHYRIESVIHTPLSFTVGPESKPITMVAEKELSWNEVKTLVEFYDKHQPELDTHEGYGADPAKFLVDLFGLMHFKQEDIRQAIEIEGEIPVFQAAVHFLLVIGLERPQYMTKEIQTKAAKAKAQA